MLEYFSKKYEELFSSVLDPVFKRVMCAPWWVKLLSLALMGSGYWAAQNPELLEKRARELRTFVRVIGQEGTRPIQSEQAQERLSDVRRRLLRSNRNDVNVISTGTITAWSAAQAVVSLDDDIDSEDEKKRFLAFIAKTRLPACACWAELNNEGEDRAWTFISGWVLMAKASSAVVADAEEVRFLLKNQNADGSWQPSPRSDDPRYKSTYTTAWAALGLHAQSQLMRKQNPEAARQLAESAERAASWLLNNRQEKCRWRPYPNLKSSSPSGSVSGLVLHALHTIIPAELNGIDEEWLDNLPEVTIPASVGENSYVELFQGGRTQIDHFVQLTMPWMLIGTIDAYGSGTLLQKVRALNWMEDLILHESVKNADAEQSNWWRAELGLAINHAAR